MPPGSRQAVKAPDRRPLASRDARRVRRTAAALARSAVTPNQISVASVVFAAIGAAALAWWHTPLALLLAAVMLQLRLLCKLFDGMVAIEGGIEVHRRMPISLTFDHRAATGGEAARFLKALLDDLAQPQ